MRGWIATALVVTFLSGASSGFVAGRASAPPPENQTWIQQHVEDVRRAGVTDEADLQEAEEIYLRFQQRVGELKGKVETLFEARLTALAQDTEGQIQAILNRYTAPADSGKEN